MATIREALALAFDHHDAGRSDEAATLCQRILDADPDCADALHLLGILHAHAGRLPQAAELFRRAVAANGSQPSLHSNLGNALRALGRGAEAIASYRRAIALAPAHGDALSNLAAALDAAALDAPLAAAGLRGDAAAVCRRALFSDPDKPEAAFNLGAILRGAGRLQEAAAAFRLAVSLAPGWPDASHAHADAEAQCGRPLSAAAGFLRVARLDPGTAGPILRAAGIFSRRGEFARAEALLHDLLARRPDLPEARFNLAALHHESGRLTQALAGFRRTLALTPADGEAWYGLGSVLKDLSRLDAAVAAYRRSLAVRPDFEEADLDLRLVLSQRFPAWHFTMLADEARNDAYRGAIEKAVRPGSVVLEIGTGAGLLALMAARAGAAHVYTCEISQPLAEIARGVAADNGFSDRITVLNCRSTELRVGVDLPEPADVLISEILDAGLLGEGAASSIAKAVNTLVKPGAAILPKGAVLKAMPIECPALRTANPVGTIAGFDLSRLEGYRNTSYMVLPLSDLPHRPLGGATEVAWIDLCDPPGPGLLAACRLPLLRRGTVHAVAFWFDLHLDADIVLSTEPGSPSRHWQQAVQFLNTDVPAEPGSALSLDLRYTAGRLVFSVARTGAG